MSNYKKILIIALAFSYSFNLIASPNKSSKLELNKDLFQTKNKESESPKKYAFNFYAGISYSYSKFDYGKNNTFNFDSAGGSCSGDANCDPFSSVNLDPLLTFQQTNNYSFSDSISNHDVLPVIGINFEYKRFKLGIEGSYSFKSNSVTTQVNNWYTLPTNPEGINGGLVTTLPLMGENLDAGIKETFSNFFTISAVPEFKFTDKFSGFFRIGYAGMKFESESFGTRAGAGNLGVSGNSSENLHGYILGLGLATEFNDFIFRLEYTRTQFSDFDKSSNEFTTTAQNTINSVQQVGSPFDPIILNRTSAINFDGNINSKYRDLTQHSITLSVIKEFSM